MRTLALLVAVLSCFSARAALGQTAEDPDAEQAPTSAPNAGEATGGVPPAHAAVLPGPSRAGSGENHSLESEPPRGASKERASGPTEDAPSETTSWYSGETLALDTVAIGFLTASAYSDRGEGALLATGITIYLAGGPVVHWAHGRPWAALGSLGLRAGLPVLGALAGAPFVTCRHDEETECDFTPTMVGLIIGFGAAIITDAAVLARERKANESARSPISLGLSPMLDAKRGAGGLAISGSFR